MPVKAGGFIEASALRTFHFAQQKFKDLFHAWGDPVSQDSLTSASGTADNRNRISKKIGPVVISSDLSPTGS